MKTEMRLGRVIPILFLMLLVFGSCKKPVAKVNTDYVGSWEAYDGSAYYYIDIDDYSFASYEKYGAAETSVAGRAKIRGDKLKILFKKFKIDQHPELETDQYGNEVWTMILDGVIYYRY